MFRDVPKRRSADQSVLANAGLAGPRIPAAFTGLDPGSCQGLKDQPSCTDVFGGRGVRAQPASLFRCERGGMVARNLSDPRHPEAARRQGFDAKLVTYPQARGLEDRLRDADLVMGGGSRPRRGKRCRLRLGRHREWGRWDSNPLSLRHWIYSPARLSSSGAPPLGPGDCRRAQRPLGPSHLVLLVLAAPEHDARRRLDFRRRVWRVSPRARRGCRCGRARPGRGWARWSRPGCGRSSSAPAGS